MPRGSSTTHWRWHYLIPNTSTHASPLPLFFLPFLPFLFFASFVFQDRVFLCSPGCPWIHAVDKAGLELRHPPASASRVLRLKASTIPQHNLFLFFYFLKNKIRGWRDGSSVKNTGCSTRGPRFNSQHSHIETNKSQNTSKTKQNKKRILAH